jgi:hypothetical protein
VKHQLSRTVFGNTITGIPAFFSGITWFICKTAFGTDRNLYKLAAAERGEVFQDFGVLTIIDRERSSGDGETMHDIDPAHSIIIGTIRMGFGHWRMAIALASAAHRLGYTPYLLDLLSFKDSTAAKSIHLLESAYNTFSRLSQEFPVFNTLIWERCTGSSGKKLSASLRERTLSQLFVPVFEHIPATIPLLSTHPWVGHAATLAGMKNVISIIPDNLAMAFWLVEGTVHTVQSPSAYMGYRTLFGMEDRNHKITRCLPASMIREAGHYVDYEITSNIELDCSRRLERCDRMEPRRFLLTMGGAGAQAVYFGKIAHLCKNAAETGKAALLINMGDHEGRWNALKTELLKFHMSWTFHDDWQETKKFAAYAATGLVTGVHVFLHKEFYAAVYTTNILMRISDIVITKPSELSYYPVPKLFIHRVGRHEAWGAIRGSEMGDGTIETDSEPALSRTLQTLIEEGDLLKLYCHHILINNRDGVYNGAASAVSLAVSGVQEQAE